MTEPIRIPDLFGPSRSETKRLDLGFRIVLDPELRGKRILLLTPSEAKAREEFQRFKELFKRWNFGKAMNALALQRFIEDRERSRRGPAGSVRTGVSQRGD